MWCCIHIQHDITNLQHHVVCCIMMYWNALQTNTPCLFIKKKKHKNIEIMQHFTSYKKHKNPAKSFCFAHGPGFFHKPKWCKTWVNPQYSVNTRKAFKMHTKIRIIPQKKIPNRCWPHSHTQGTWAWQAELSPWSLASHHSDQAAGSTETKSPGIFCFNRRWLVEIFWMVSGWRKSLNWRPLALKTWYIVFTVLQQIKGPQNRKVGTAYMLLSSIFLLRWLVGTCFKAFPTILLNWDSLSQMRSWKQVLNQTPTK